MGVDAKLNQSGREFTFATNIKKSTKRILDTIKSSYVDITCNVIFTQISAKAGIIRVGETAIGDIF